MKFFFRWALIAAALTASTPAPADETHSLTIYTYESFTADWGPGPAVTKAFKAECACDINWVSLADGVAILNRLKLEGASTKADLVLGLDDNLLVEARKTGLFTTHGQDLAKSKLPVAWTDDTFLPYDYAHFAVVYDRDKLKSPPKSLAELVDGSAADGKIVLEDPRTSTPGLGFLLWMKAVYGDKSGEAWTKLAPRILTVTPGWSEAYALFTKGEAPMVLSYVTSPAYHEIAEKTERYQALNFPEGHPLQVEVAAALAGSHDLALARKFLAFIQTAGFQDQIPTGNWMFPAAATSNPLPKEFDALVKPVKTLTIDPAMLAEKRAAWTAEWLGAMSH